MIEIKDLTVKYADGTTAVDEFSLSVNEGENMALIGANGAGKTTLLLSLVGINQSKGSIKIDNIPLLKDTIIKIRQKTGMVFQNPDDQLFMPTIYDDVAFGLRNMGAEESEVEIKVFKCLKNLSIEHLKDKTAYKLSGGEKRMAALATVLVTEPDVLLMDEPTAFLDPKARRNLINNLNNIQKTKLIATHDLTFALETCKYTALIKNGRLFEKGLSKDLLFDKKIMEDCGVEAIGEYYGA